MANGTSGWGNFPSFLSVRPFHGRRKCIVGGMKESLFHVAQLSFSGSVPRRSAFLGLLDDRHLAAVVDLLIVRQRRQSDCTIALWSRLARIAFVSTRSECHLSTHLQNFTTNLTHFSQLKFICQLTKLTNIN